ncbi:Conserved_hypothetical protein [Hexamita inflata]|uniref:Uncharacterized protein n=1 Tax=Hexamita inflata TaxID=28002 RepID=A0AA86PCK5_9EUKA|nr:Conserved hypothetical protein [Hexamita inflata]
MSAVFHSNCQEFVVGTKSTIEFWNIFDEKPIKIITHNNDHVHTMTYNHDCTLLAYAGDKICIIDVQTKEQLVEFKDQYDSCDEISFSPNNQEILCLYTHKQMDIRFTKFDLQGNILQFIEDEIDLQKTFKSINSNQISSNRQELSVIDLKCLKLYDKTENKIRWIGGQHKLHLENCLFENAYNLSDQNKALMEQLRDQSANSDESEQ